MAIPRAVVSNGFFLDGFLGYCQIHMHHAICRHRGGKHSYLQRRERLAHIAIRFQRQMRQSILRDFELHVAEPPLRVGRSAAQQCHNIRILHRLQGENLRTGEHSRIDGEIGILRSRPDKAYRTALQMRQEHILLRLIEAVKLVHKKNCSLPVHGLAGLGLRNFLANIAHIGLHTIKHHKIRTCLACNDVCQRGLPHTGRPIENERGETVGLNRTAQQLPRRQQVLLPGDFLQALGAHTRRQGHTQLSLFLLRRLVAPEWGE